MRRRRRSRPSTTSTSKRGMWSRGRGFRLVRGPRLRRGSNYHAADIQPLKGRSETVDAAARATRQPARERRRYRASTQEALFAYGLVLPVVLLITGLVAYPFFYAIYVSFTNRVVGNDGEWI